MPHISRLSPLLPRLPLTLLLALGLASSLRAQPAHLGPKLAAIPLFSYDSDDGFGYGLRVNRFVYDGTTVPYRSNLSVQAFFSTRGTWAHRVYVDLPAVRDRTRLEIEALYEKEDFANYYGDESREIVSRYARERRTYRRDAPGLRITGYRDLRSPFRLRLEALIARFSVSPNADAGNVLFDTAPRGVDGGASGQLSAALQIDTRDDYTNPISGVLEELRFLYGLGNAFSGGRISYDHRLFQPLGDRLVLAHRITAGVVYGSVPFYERFALGGDDSVRGMPSDSRRGKGRLLSSIELRGRAWTLLADRGMHAGWALFVDGGGVFSGTSDHWRAGTGAGLRVIWYSTVMRGDIAYSEGRTGVYATFAHAF